MQDLRQDAGHLRLLFCRGGVDNPLQRLGGTGGVEGAEHEMAGLGGREGHSDGLSIA